MSNGLKGRIRIFFFSTTIGSGRSNLRPQRKKSMSITAELCLLGNNFKVYKLKAQ